MKRILIVAGEASADRYGARLVRKLQALHPDDPLEFFGTGGDEMQKAGVRLLRHVRDLASIGPREALAHFQTYYKTFRNLMDACLEKPPSVAVLLDFPEFNLRLAKKMKRAGVKVIYYISPQLWAWRSGRIRTVRNHVDLMLVILPFEEDYYRRRGVNVEFVGHPLLEEFFPETNRERFLGCLNLDPGRKTIALIPGSRNNEVKYMLPTLIRASQRIMRRIPAQCLISAAPSVRLDEIRRLAAEALRGDPNALYFKIATAASRDILANSDFGIVKSGTSTLEAALVGIPFLIVYKISALSWHVGNILIRSPFKGLVNLIGQEEIVPEFMQHEATPEALSDAALEYLEKPEKAAALKSRLAEVRNRLSTRSASDAAASAVLRYI